MPTKDNGEETITTEEKPKTISQLLDEGKEDGEEEIDPAILDKVDLTLPKEYVLETMAEELVSHLSAYATAKTGWRTARAAGEHAKAEQFYKQMSFSRLASALIQSEYPGVKKLADKLALYRKRTVEKQREAQMRR